MKLDYLYVNEYGQLQSYNETITGIYKVQIVGLFVNELDYYILV
jgi:hypothetical protein